MAMRQTKPKRVLKGGRNLYKRGYALETRVKKRLEASGWVAVRAGGSHGDGDVWAARRIGWVEPGSRLVFFQCKRDGVISPRERLDLTTEAKKAGAEAYVIDGKYRVREVTDWVQSDWQRLEDVF